MSLDFYLYRDGDMVFGRNITHNLNKMAAAAGIYEVLWRPDEHEITHAHQCVEPLSKGLIELLTNRKKYEAYNPSNGWGAYPNLISFVCYVLEACASYPNATVVVSR